MYNSHAGRLAGQQGTHLAGTPWIHQHHSALRVAAAQLRKVALLLRLRLWHHRASDGLAARASHIGSARRVQQQRAAAAAYYLRLRGRCCAGYGRSRAVAALSARRSRCRHRILPLSVQAAALRPQVWQVHRRPQPPAIGVALAAACDAARRRRRAGGTGPPPAPARSGWLAPAPLYPATAGAAPQRAAGTPLGKVAWPRPPSHLLVAACCDCRVVFLAHRVRKVLPARYTSPRSWGPMFAAGAALPGPATHPRL